MANEIIDVPNNAPETLLMPPVKTDGAASSTGDRPEPLFPAQDSETFRKQWQEIQVGFVDAPREAEVFSGERGRLEADWTQGHDVSTEDLRQALRATDPSSIVY